MKDEEFYSTIKIVTGEEIVAKVIYLEDEDKVMLEDPLQVEMQRSRKGALEISGFAFKEWMSATLEDMFCLLYTSPSPRDRSLSRMPSSA